MKLEPQHSERDDRRLGPTRVGSPEPQACAREPMKCVWSGYPDYNRDCRSRIPASVVVKAWHREIQVKGTVEGFFYFSWRSGVWLAYGLEDGSVRGVYCPTHCVDRDTRGAQGAQPRTRTPADAPSGDAPSGDAPSGDAPSGDALVRDEPSWDAPVRDTPSGDAPSGDAPVRDEPSWDAPVRDTPSGDAPAEDAPAEDAPADVGENAPAKVEIDTCRVTRLGVALR